MNTRNLQGGVASRISDQSVVLEYYSEDDNGDGSATSVFLQVVSHASVIPLQSTDIQRLELAGLYIKDGVTITFPATDSTAPDTVTHNVDEYTAKKYRVVKTANDNGIMILTCDFMSLGAANDDL